MEKIDHIGIVVGDMEKALDMYENVYGLHAVKIETHESAKLKIAFIPVGEVLIELLSPTSSRDGTTVGTGGIRQFLDENGEGFHHIAFRVEDIDGTMAVLKKIEIPFRDAKPRPGADGSRIAFIEPAATQNVLTELVERDREVTG